MSEALSTYSLEVRPNDTVDYGQLATDAAAEVAAINIAEINRRRDPVEGALFRDSKGLPEVAIDLAPTEEGFLLNLHLPHFDTIAPADSSFDELMRLSFAYDNASGQRTADQIWRKIFGADEWPSQTISVPLRRLSDGFLRAGQATTLATTCQPSLTVTNSVKKGLETDSDVPSPLHGYLAVAKQLAKQRFQNGAPEVYYKDKFWVQGTDGILVPLSNAALIKRELLLVGAQGIGNLLDSEQAPGLFLTDSQRPLLDRLERSILIHGYFSGEISGSVLMNAISEAWGTPQIDTSHDGNRSAYGKLVAPISGRRMYSALVNARTAEYVKTIGVAPYTAHQVSEFALVTRIVAQRNRRERTDQAVTAGLFGISWAQERGHAGDARLVDQLAPRSDRAFHVAYNCVRQGKEDPDQFLASCIQRLREKGRIPTDVVLDILFPAEEFGAAEQLREPILLYVANNPHLTAGVVGVASKGGYLCIANERSMGGRTAVLMTRNEQEFIGGGRDGPEARARALVKAATGLRRDAEVDYYWQHPDAPKWTVDPAMTSRKASEES